MICDYIFEKGNPIFDFKTLREDRKEPAMHKIITTDNSNSWCNTYISFVI